MFFVWYIHTIQWCCLPSLSHAMRTWNVVYDDTMRGAQFPGILCYSDSMQIFCFSSIIHNAANMQSFDSRNNTFIFLSLGRRTFLLQIVQNSDEHWLKVLWRLYTRLFLVTWSSQFCLVKIDLNSKYVLYYKNMKVE